MGSYQPQLPKSLRTRLLIEFQMSKGKIVMPLALCGLPGRTQESILILCLTLRSSPPCIQLAGALESRPLQEERP